MKKTEYVGEIEIDDAPEHWLDGQEFYELCQQYRWAEDGMPRHAGLPTASQSFEAIKDYIRLHTEGP